MEKKNQVQLRKRQLIKLVNRSNLNYLDKPVNHISPI
jgi:hypothetical protein